MWPIFYAKDLVVCVFFAIFASSYKPKPPIMRNLSFGIIFTLCVFFTCVAFAQGGEADRRFMVYDASNGLADNSAQTVACTRTGRVMVSTL